jgi:hypothetical protein
MEGISLKISTILDQIDLGHIALPEFQRGYVWNRDQVRKLMNSLYRRHPIGGLLVWVTQTGTAVIRGNQHVTTGPIKLLLDGQQRITTLYGIIRGRAPAFFQGNAQTFTGLYFNLEDEVFEFYAPMKMKDNPLWVSVTEVMQKGATDIYFKIGAVDKSQDEMKLYLQRLNRLASITDIDLHIEEITGDSLTVDEVVEIFNEINSGGTKLSKGDLALAKICAEWPQARDEMRKLIQKWANAGYHFEMDWLLRNVTTVLTGKAMFSALKEVTPENFKAGLHTVEKCVNYLLNLVSARLGLDHDRVLGGRYAFPVMSRYVAQRKGHLSIDEQNKLLYWYIHASIWGRYSGSTESVISQDLSLIENHDGALERLINQIKISRGDLRIRPEDFSGSSIGARFYPLLYLLTRTCSARDWGTGYQLSAHLLGKGNKLQVHHIFPKARLYEAGYERSEVNAIANFCFLTADTNLEISDRDPAEYFEEIEKQYPGALASQWVPMDRSLWKIERYRDFLAARRELLAQAANDVLDGLLNSSSSTVADVESPTVRSSAELVDMTQDEDIRDFLQWISTQGLPVPKTDVEIYGSDGSLLAIAELAWPEGVQRLYSEPVALILDPGVDIDALQQAGYKVFSSISSAQSYLRSISPVTTQA